VSEVPVEIATAGGPPVRLYVETVGPAGEAEVGFSVVDGLRQVTDAIGAVAGEVAGALEKAAPQKFSVELGFELKSESGGLVALLARAGGTATIKVTMEWERKAPATVQV
jgi:hypothetical protein